MKQVLQSLSSGDTELADVPAPQPLDGSLIIGSKASVISAGTERMLVEFGKANYLEKAKQQPDKVVEVIQKVKTDGLGPTINTVRSKLDQPLALGYCNAGVVLNSGVDGFVIGDRVASNGYHAEIVRVPKHLCAKIPDNVDDESAAFTALGSIALQGIRLLNPSLGESAVVSGLGLIGLMAVQILKASGCRVLGIDTETSRCKLAESFGIDVINLSVVSDPVVVAERFSAGRGVDSVLITATTKSNEVVNQAAEMCRKRGKVVLVGVVGLNLRRDAFYKKEITFQVSASYGPGRYDPTYEENGHDYPVGYVRWTEQRNFEAILEMLSKGTLDVKPLISHRFEISEATLAYSRLNDSDNSLGIVLSYPGTEFSNLSRKVGLTRSIESELVSRDGNQLRPSVSFIGSGNYATGVLIPAFVKAGVVLKTVASSSGLSGVHAGRKYGFELTTTDNGAILSTDDSDAIVISTRHSSHAQLVIEGLRAGKHVFVEKPLCLTLDELSEIEEACSPTQVLMVGFNRRFAPQVQKMKQLLAMVDAPKTLVMTVNAGYMPPDHWTQDPQQGGGRIVGEGCHFVDLLRFIAGNPIVRYSLTSLDSKIRDTVTIQLEFSDGSIGTIHYFSNGSRFFPKERLEVFASGKVLQLDNFRKLTGYGWDGFKKMNLWRQDKGQNSCVRAFVDAIHKDGPHPITLGEILEVSRISIELAGHPS